MRSMHFVPTVGVGIGLALAAMIPAASQARETAIRSQAASAHSSQALIRLKAFDDDWTVAPRRYGMH